MRIIPNIWFDGTALEAAEFYAGVFREAAVKEGIPGKGKDTTTSAEVAAAPAIPPTSISEPVENGDGKKKKRKHEGETAEERAERKRKKKEKKEKKKARESGVSAAADDDDDSD